MSPTGDDVELLASLGVTPVLGPDTIERAVWTQNALPAPVEKSIEASADFVVDATALEAIAASKPDLIVMTGDDIAGSYKQLQAIAPVLAVTSTSEIDGSWQDRILPLGRALDLAAKAQHVLDQHDSHLAKVRAEHPEFEGKTATYAILYGGEYGLAYMSGAGSDTEKLFQALGFAPSPRAKRFAGDADNTVSMENLAALDGDALLLSDNSKGEIANLTGNKLFQNLEVVKQKRTAIITNPAGDSFVFDGKETKGNLAWAVANPGPLADVWAANQLAPILSSVLK